MTDFEKVKETFNIMGIDFDSYDTVDDDGIFTGYRICYSKICECEYEIYFDGDENFLDKERKIR